MDNLLFDDFPLLDPETIQTVIFDNITDLAIFLDTGDNQISASEEKVRVF